MNKHTSTYWSNGVLREVVDGVLRREIPKQNGIARYWHANGVLAKEMTLLDGVANGLVREWHDNGELFRETPYNNGVIDGVVKQWSASGILLGECRIHMGRGIKREWNDNGTIKSEIEEFADGCYKTKTWDDLGKTHESYFWKGKHVSKTKFLINVDNEDKI